MGYLYQEGKDPDSKSSFMDMQMVIPLPQNWRLFNMLDLAFLSMEGYPIDEDIMRREHAQAIVNYYAGMAGIVTDSLLIIIPVGLLMYMHLSSNKWYGYREGIISGSKI